MKHETKTRRLGGGRGIALAALLLGSLAAFALPGARSTFAHTAHRPSAAGTISIGTKNFDEEYIISSMYQLLLEKAGFTVTYHDLAQTSVLQNALLRGDIDLYPEYTGTGLGTVLGIAKPISNAITAYDTVKTKYEKKFHLTWLLQSPMNDTNTVAVTKATARKYHLKTLTDLAKVAKKLSFAALPDCKGRPDCLKGLKSAYKIHFNKITYVASTDLTLAALRSGQVDAAEVFSTDGRIKAYNLVTLADNKQAVFPADHIAPVVRDSTLAKYPKIKTILNPLAKYITTKVMIRLNSQYDLQHKKAIDLARSFLTSKHLL